LQIVESGAEDRNLHILQLFGNSLCHRIHPFASHTALKAVF